MNKLWQRIEVANEASFYKRIFILRPSDELLTSRQHVERPSNVVENALSLSREEGHWGI